MESQLEETEQQQQQSSSTTTSTIPTLQLFSFPPLKSPQNSSANLTSPLHTSASVPFSWEEQPGKPLPCLTLALPSNNNNTVKCLELPPRLLNETKFTKTPSPTTVLEGPYSYNNNNKLSSFEGKSSSFRFLRKKQGSFDGISALSLGGSRGNSPERGFLGSMVLSRSNSLKRDKGLFGSWKKRGGVNSFKGSKNEAHHGGNFVFPSSLSDDGGCVATTTGCDGGGAAVKVTRASRKGNFLGLSSPNKSHFWAAIYGAFKQVIPSPKRSTKWKKDAW